MKQALRDYITAKDGREYEDLAEDLVCFRITHNHLKLEMLDIRFNLRSTIQDVKYKIYTHCGTLPQDMRLCIMNEYQQVLANLEDDSKMLGFYNVSSGMHLHVTDVNPFSLARGGGLEDTSLVPKYNISEADYDKREKTVRSYKRQQLAKDPTWKSKLSEEKVNVPRDESSVANIKVGDRCEVQPGGRRGTIRFVGEVVHLSGGFWVGVEFDEPVGKGDGTYKSKTYFTCPDKYGGFIRPENISVGEYPPEDDFDEL